MPKLARGSVVILLMCAVALGLSIYAAWYRYAAGDFAYRFWQKEAALRIRSAQKVNLLSLMDEQTPPKEGSKERIDTITIAGKPYQITKTTDITTARGLIHARHALLEDASLDETAQPNGPPPSWHRIIQFIAKDGATTSVAINLDTGWLGNLDTGAIVKLNKPDFKQEKRDPGLVAYVKRLAPRPKDVEEAKSQTKSAKRGP